MTEASKRWAVVTLRGRAEFSLSADPDDFLFFRDVPVRVAEAIAEELASLTGPENEPLFDIEDYDDPDADVAEALGIQLKFKTFDKGSSVGTPAR